MASVTALLVVGLAGAAVHDEADDPVTAEREDPLGEPPGTGTGAGTTASAPTTPASAVPPSGGVASGTSPTSGGTDAPAAPGPSGVAGTVNPGSGLAASGNGEVASGTVPLADTGSYPLAVPGALLLGLGSSGRILVRTARRVG